MRPILVPTILATLLAMSLVAGPAAAHEYWIEPARYQVPADGTIVADLVNGEKFAGTDLPYFPRRFARLDAVSGEVVAPVEGRLGDSPAIDIPAPDDGLAVLVYVSNPSILTYDDWETFAGFVEHKDFAGAVARHEARGLPKDAVVESYARFAKSLVAVGTGAGGDVAAGLETEIVAMANPYTDDMSAGMPVQVLYDQMPRADVQVELYEKSPDGTVDITVHRTDETGTVTLPVTPGMSYLVDAVVLREAGPVLQFRTGAMWESLWASLTFAVPDE